MLLHFLLSLCSNPAAQVTADPESINVLPEYGSDPRTPDKLLDGAWGWQGRGGNSAKQWHVGR